jgi:hypothetical protein
VGQLEKRQNDELSTVMGYKIQALVILCDEFLCAFIVEAVLSVFNCLLHLIIITLACATQKLLQVCEQVKITWIQIWTERWMAKFPRQSQQAAHM